MKFKVSILMGLVLPGLAWAAERDVQDELNAAMRAHANHARGAQLYGQCVACHASDAAGDSFGAVPRIAGQHYRVLLKQLVDFRHGRRQDFRMGDMADRHRLEGPQDLADVALYVASQDRGGTRGVGDGRSVERGRSLYLERCQGCHGIEGRGDDPGFVPRLAGQHYSYLVRQMYDAVDGRRPSMIRTHSPRVAPLDYDDVRAVADYLSRIGAPADRP